ncbi:MAG: hypothetical protein JNJ58_12230 [Chitinophagaceae bacterium]|nr:hypothetical protein [Chitinophagaceae bacterium]
MLQRLSAQPIRFHHFGVNDGLSQGNVTCFMQDHLGQMWIGSWGGLNVYDGFRNKIYRQKFNQKKGLQGDMVSNIIETNENEMAIATSSGLNIYYRDKDSFALFTTKKENQAFVILRREQNHLVLLHKNDLFRFNLQTKKFETDKPQHTEQFRGWLKCLKSGKNHSEYLHVRLYDLFVNKVSSNDTIKLMLEEFFINDLLYEASTHCIYLATLEGFVRYDIYHSSNSKTIINGHIKSLFQHGDSIFVGSKDSGMYIYALTKNAIVSHHIARDNVHQNISGNYIRNFYVDRQKNLWLSALGSGVNYCKLYPEIAQTRFSASQIETQSPLVPQIAAMAVDQNNKLWAADIIGKIVLLDSQYQIEKTFTPRDMDPVRLPFSIQQIFVSQQNDIYVLYDFGLFYTRDRKRFYMAKNIDQSRHENVMYHMCALTDSTALLSTQRGLMVLNTVTHCIDTTMNPRIKKRPRFIFKDNRNRIYFKINDDDLGVYTFHGNALKKDTIIKCSASLHAAYEETDTIWFGSRMGLMGLDKSTYKYIMLDEEDVLPDPEIFAIRPDPIQKRAIWCTSHRGIFKYDLNKRQYFSVGLNDGLTTLAFNHNSSIRGNGDLVFGSSDGIAWINPKEMQPDVKLNDLEVYDFKLNNQLPDHLNDEHGVYTIPYAFNSISFRLMQINFPPSEFPIRFKLLGLENDWNTELNPIEIRYPNLREGHYQFVAQYYHRNEGWVEKKFFELRILAPWYRSATAYILYILIVVILIWIIFQTYVKIKLHQQSLTIEKQQAIMNERSRISADLHDDIGSTLSSVSIYNDLILANATKKPQVIPQLSGQISKQIRELMMRTEDIIWSLKIDPGSNEHEPLAKRVSEYAAELLESINIHADIRISDDVEQMLHQPEQRRNILMIIKEAMNNCRKYSEASSFILHMEIEDKFLRMDMKDNGKGFDPEQIQAGDGLGNMQERARAMRGTTSIVSAPGEGTDIICRIPIAIFSYKG